MTRFGALDALITDLIDRGELKDAQYAIGFDGQAVETRAFGGATVDSRFCIFSSTKPVFASLLWRLIDQGLISLETPIVDIWPEFGQHGKDAIVLQHLLLHTAGIPSPMISHEAIGSREDRAHEIEQWPLELEPGTAYTYHPFSAGWVLAEVVTRITGMPHGEALRSEILEPLGIDRLELGVPRDRLGDVRRIDYIRQAPFDVFQAVTGQPSPPQDPGAEDPFDIRGFANDPVVIGAGAPGGGAISDAASVATFYQALLHNPGGLWSDEILTDATSNIRNTFPDGLALGAPANRTIGLIIAGSEHRRFALPQHGIDLVMHPFGPAVSPQTFGHGGGGGQIAFADPTTGVSFCFLSNVIDRDAFGAFQNQQDIIEAAVTSIA
ncbi:serine hydrolase domain-containing protein [Microbacterium jejuense]|uniref:serine hydrolase domain-containing protein n=1 Tax=Microbacterium jejuense TaxID=1263637 RepID=UPI0031EE9D89